MFVTARFSSIIDSIGSISDIGSDNPDVFQAALLEVISMAARFINGTPLPFLLIIFMVLKFARASLLVMMIITWIRGTWLDGPITRRVILGWIAWALIEMPCVLSGFDMNMQLYINTFNPNAVIGTVYDYGSVFNYFVDIAAAFVGMEFFPLYNLLYSASVALELVLGSLLMSVIILSFGYHLMGLGDIESNHIITLLKDLGLLVIVSFLVYGWNYLAYGWNPWTDVPDVMSALYDFIVLVAFIFSTQPLAVKLVLFMCIGIATTILLIRILITWTRGTLKQAPNTSRKVSWVWFWWLLIKIPCTTSGFEKSMSIAASTFDPASVVVQPANVLDYFFQLLGEYLVTDIYPLYNLLYFAGIGLSTILGTVLLGVVLFTICSHVYSAATDDVSEHSVMKIITEIGVFIVAGFFIYGWNYLAYGWLPLSPTS